MGSDPAAIGYGSAGVLVSDSQVKVLSVEGTAAGKKEAFDHSLTEISVFEEKSLHYFKDIRNIMGVLLSKDVVKRK